MPLIDTNLTIKEAQEYLQLNGVEWSEVWIRMQISAGRIKSVKILNSRAIPRTELERIIREKKQDN